jgi:signal transduction histidine kinase/response regulator RpfG family c-di-GMP phosphodiesterase
MNKAIKEQDYFHKIAVRSTRISAVVYIIIKQIFFLSLDFLTLPVLIKRSVGSALIFCLIFLISSSKKITKRQMSWMLPLSIVFTEGVLMILYGADQIFPLLTIGCVLLSLLYIDTIGLLITIISTFVIFSVTLFAFEFNPLNSDYTFQTGIFLLISTTAVNIIIFLIGKYSIETLIRFRQDSENANASKTQFLAYMSHEIRTPLNSIIGVSQIELQKTNAPKEYAAALEKIYTSGSSLLGIINDILDMTKIETGKLELNFVKYDVPSLINDTVQLNIVRIGSKKIKFILDIDKNIPMYIYGDELRIRQILNNLLSNAIKYTETGHVKLSASHTVKEEDIILRFAVEDTGQGMKAEDQKRLFSEYLRFNVEANRATEGTGIGLTITKKLIDMMDGTIEVDSEYGKGSIFTVTIRQKAVECFEIGEELAQKLNSLLYTGTRLTAQHQITREPMPYGKVLVVDDVESNLYVAKGLLLTYKLIIDTADSGFIALENIEKGRPYDIIFMDHMMPQMDGIETTQKIRELGYKGSIVALTANAMVGNEEMFKQKGFDGFISKPIDIRVLNSVLNRFVRDKYPEEAQKCKEEKVEETTIPVVDQKMQEMYMEKGFDGFISKPIDVRILNSFLNKFIRDKYPEEAQKYKAKRVEGSTPSAVDPKLLKIVRQDAEKAVKTIRQTIKNGDIKLFTITVHAMKSALANINEKEKSQKAFALEEAGHKNDLDYINANTDSFLQMLEQVVIKLAPPESAVYDEAITEDTVFLREQLLLIKSACEEYDDTAAYISLDRLKEKSWKKETSAALEKIRDTLFLHSDFDEAAVLADKLYTDK